jgi:hypothetical protein
LILINGEVLNHKFDTSTTLLSLLSHFEQEEDKVEAAYKENFSTSQAYTRRHFGEYHGVPPVENFGPEVNGKPTIQLTITLKGRMVPVITVGEKKYSADTHDFSAVSLSEVLSSSGEGAASLALSHKYIKPHMTEEQQRAAVDNFKRKMGLAGGPVGPQRAAAPAAAPAPAARPVAAAETPAQRKALLEREQAMFPMNSVCNAQVSVVLTRSRVRVPEPPAATPAETPAEEAEAAADGEAAEEVNEEKEKEESADEPVVSPPVSSVEVLDSDDEAFYEPNAGDLALLAKLYKTDAAPAPTPAPAPAPAASAAERREAKVRQLQARLMGKPAPAPAAAGAPAAPGLAPKQLRLRLRLPAPALLMAEEPAEPAPAYSWSATATAELAAHASMTVADLYAALDALLAPARARAPDVPAPVLVAAPARRLPRTGSGSGLSLRSALGGRNSALGVEWAAEGWALREADAEAARELFHGDAQVRTRVVDHSK